MRREPRDPKGSEPTAFSLFTPSHALRHKAAHHVRCLLLLVRCGVGVGPQGEARVVVAQHLAPRLDVHIVLERFITLLRFVKQKNGFLFSDLLSFWDILSLWNHSTLQHRELDRQVVTQNRIRRIGSA